MQNKLQELTDKLYNEGLCKGKQEAEQLKKNAQAEAEKIIAEARAKADAILEEVKKEAEQTRIKVENDLRMASTQTITAIRHQVEQILTAKALNAPVKAVLSDGSIVKELIISVVKAFDAANPEPKELEVILPASLQKEFSEAVEKDILSEMSNGVEISYSKQIAAGFRIGPKDGGFIISFTEGDFERIIAQYLRPATKKLLFG